MWPNYFGTRTNLWNNNTSIINNNIYFKPPHMHSCNMFGSGFNWMLGFGMANTFMSNLFGTRNYYTPTLPYYNFTNTTGLYSPTQQGGTIQDTILKARKDLDTLGFTQKDGYTIAYGENGKLIYSYNKDGVNISAGSLKELLAQIYTNNTPGNWLDTSKKEDPELLEPEIIDDGKKDPLKSNLGNDGKQDPNKVKYSLTNLETLGQKNLEWAQYGDLNDKQKTNFKNGMTVSDYFKTLGITETPELKEALIKANPNAIKDGKIVDVNKLTLMIEKEKPTDKNNRVLFESSGCKIEIKDGKRLYYINGQPKNEVEFMRLRPKTFFNFDPGVYNTQNLSEAIRLYDKYVGAKVSREYRGGGTPAVFTNNFIESSNINYNGKKITISVEYKNTRPIDNDRYTDVYETDKNGNINMSMKDIYANLVSKWGKL